MIFKRILREFKQALLIPALIFAFSNLSAQSSVYDLIADSEDHNTLEAAIDAAGLDGALDTTGTYTVFAPTDAAFAALGQETIDALLVDPEGDLTSILTYHVLGIEVMKSGLSNGLQATTLNGKNITIQLMDDMAYVNNVMISATDLMGNNGVVHVIDAVILPSTATVVDVIVNSDAHNTLEAAVLAAGLETTLSTAGEFTVFAPTDAAFAALGQERIDELLADPSGALTTILTYHVVGNDVRAGDLSNGLRAATVQGEELTFTLMDNMAYVDDVMISMTDLVAGNGVVHVIDAVLLPNAVQATNVIENDRSMTLQVYPNPASDFIQVQSDDQILSIQILDLKGRVIGEFPGNNQRINVSEYPSGNYIIAVYGESAFSTQQLLLN